MHPVQGDLYSGRVSEYVPHMLVSKWNALQYGQRDDKNERKKNVKKGTRPAKANIMQGGLVF